MVTLRGSSFSAKKSVQSFIITAGILLLAAYIMLWKLESLPSALHSDEAWEGIDAARILYQGARPIFLVDNNGRQPLFAYMVAGLFWLFGPTTPAIRLAAELPVIGLVFGAMMTAEALFKLRVC